MSLVIAIKKEMSVEVECCPSCGSEKVALMAQCVACTDCGTSGPNARADAEKVESWNGMPRDDRTREEQVAE